MYDSDNDNDYKDNNYKKGDNCISALGFNGDLWNKQINWFHQYLVLRHIIKLYLVHFEGDFKFNAQTQKALQFEPAS